MQTIGWIAAIGVAAALAAAAQSTDPALQTVAESSGFRRTARHAEVVELLDRLAAASPLARRASMGRSEEGRDLPLLILSDPPVASPAEARRLAADQGRLIILAIGGIHAGEVDGKEALPILARELLLGDPRGSGGPSPLLRQAILVFAPIYNADGNERVAPDNRPGQIGPDEMGRRENAGGLDLNRDFVRLAAAESRALVRAFNDWDPHLFIDCHTTNGSFHRYIVTWEGPKAPATHRELLEYARDEFMPAVARHCETAFCLPTFVYGDFVDEHTRWETYPAGARYGTTYFGLRNRISILSEGYSYATYEQRVLGTRDFVRACVETAVARRAEIVALLRRVDEQTIRDGRQSRPDDRIALRSRAAAAPRKVVARGFVEERVDGRARSTGEPRDYEVELWTHFEPTHAVGRPFAYVFAPELSAASQPAWRAAVLENLRLHGVCVEQLAEPATCRVERYAIEQIDVSGEPLRRRRMLTFKTRAISEPAALPAGTIVVRTAQPLGTLACYLLEPECEDGLATWNFFDELRAGDSFPIWRVPDATELSTRETAD